MKAVVAMVIQGDTYDRIVQQAVTTGVPGNPAASPSQISGGSGFHQATIDASEAHNPTVYSSDSSNIV